ncbi:MAG: 4-hydroxy-tetrahydrodipicolinate reductase [Erysipelotrichaceae bacterium]|nr:4-hydroxy-tetrahydrodipicolinate reductase [Erysipelotrichaceae bacterium]
MKAVIIGQGRMGSLIKKTLEAKGHEVLGMADLISPEGLENNLDNCEMIIDFSNHANLDWVTDLAVKNNIPLVEGTTALSQDQIEHLHEASKSIPVFFSSNYSLGVAVLKELVRQANELLKDEWDIEITEIHHSQKKDAPSGTAISLLEAVNFNNRPVAYGRSPEDGKRENEIGMHSLRGGTVPGTHEVIFFGTDETVSLKHEAISRQIFVDGAVKAAEFLRKQPAGLYSMNDLISIHQSGE